MPTGQFKKVGLLNHEVLQEMCHAVYTLLWTRTSDAQLFLGCWGCVTSTQLVLGSKTSTKHCNCGCRLAGKLHKLRYRLSIYLV